MRQVQGGQLQRLLFACSSAGCRFIAVNALGWLALRSPCFLVFLAWCRVQTKAFARNNRE